MHMVLQHNCVLKVVVTCCFLNRHTQLSSIDEIKRKTKLRKNNGQQICCYTEFDMYCETKYTSM